MGRGVEAEAAAPDLRLVRPKVCQQFQFSVFKMSSRVTCGKVASSKQRNVALSCASLAAAMCVQQLPPLGRALAANYDARTRVIHLQLQRHRWLPLLLLLGFINARLAEFALRLF